MVAAPALLSSPRCLWAAQASLGEGACWSPDERALYWVDILHQHLHRLVPITGEQRSWTLPDTVSAVAQRRHGGGLAIALRRGLALFDPASGRIERLTEPEAERTGNRFNDGKCDAEGRFWAGSMDFDCSAPTGALYRFDADGSATCAADLQWPVTNGPAWSRDGRTMFLNHTVRGEVHAFDFDAQHGTLANGRVWLRFAGHDGLPDGMTTDAEGRLWIAHWGGGCVTCHEVESGRELLRVPLPASQITSVAFGGADRRTLFVTSARVGLGEAQLAEEPLAGALFAVDTDVVGVAPHRFAG